MGLFFDTCWENSWQHMERRSRRFGPAPSLYQIKECLRRHFPGLISFNCATLGSLFYPKFDPRKFALIGGIRQFNHFDSDDESSLQ